MKSPEWRWQWRRADLRHFEIFRHGPVIIYTRLPAGGTYYPIRTFPMSSESLIGISNAFSAVYLRVSVIFPTCSLYPQQKHAYSVLNPQAWTYIYTGPCLKALTECSPLDFQRLSMASLTCITPQTDQMLKDSGYCTLAVAALYCLWLWLGLMSRGIAAQAPGTVWQPVEHSHKLRGKH